jgi:hypothetical protein
LEFTHTPMSNAVAAAGVYLLAVFVPFETLTPIVRLPWQSLSNLEAVLLLALASWSVSVVVTRTAPRWRIPMFYAWLAFVVSMGVAAMLAPANRTNAVHMTGRLAASAVVAVMTFNGIVNLTRLRTAQTLVVATGIVVAVVVVLEYLQMPTVLRWLHAFRPWIATVGGQVRAGGTLQYPTIASMYLEVVFALGLGLMLAAFDAGSKWLASLWFFSLLLVGEAIAFTFTRAGLITMAVSAVVMLGTRLRVRGADAGVRLVGALATGIVVLLLSSRSLNALGARMTTEGQDDWYRAEVAAPHELDMSTNEVQYVSVKARNAGRVVWDSNDDPPIYLSYHWLAQDGERVVAFQGDRTAFTQPVGPEETASVEALVRAPRYPGTYQLEWDLVCEDRLWFSTEPSALPSTLSRATVIGDPVGGPPVPVERPKRTVRPGRFVLWRTALDMIGHRPILGVGPDNFRLEYGEAARLRNADPRTHTNNMYLEVLVGGGIVAAAAFAWFLFEVFRTFKAAARSGSPEALALVAAGLAIAVHGLVDSFLSFAGTYILFALIVGFATAAARGMGTAADAHRV